MTFHPPAGDSHLVANLHGRQGTCPTIQGDAVTSPATGATGAAHREVHRRAGGRGHRGLHHDHHVRHHAVAAPRLRAQRAGPYMIRTHQGDLGPGAPPGPVPLTRFRFPPLQIQISEAPGALIRWTTSDRRSAGRCLTYQLAIPVPGALPAVIAVRGARHNDLRTSMSMCRCGGRWRWSASPDRARPRWLRAPSTPRACTGSRRNSATTVAIG